MSEEKEFSYVKEDVLKDKKIVVEFFSKQHDQTFEVTTFTDVEVVSLSDQLYDSGSEFCEFLPRRMDVYLKQLEKDGASSEVIAREYEYLRMGSHRWDNSDLDKIDFEGIDFTELFSKRLGGFFNNSRDFVFDNNLSPVSYLPFLKLKCKLDNSTVVEREEKVIEEIRSLVRELEQLIKEDNVDIIVKRANSLVEVIA